MLGLHDFPYWDPPLDQAKRAQLHCDLSQLRRVVLYYRPLYKQIIHTQILCSPVSFEQENKRKYMDWHGIVEVHCYLND